MNERVHCICWSTQKAGAGCSTEGPLRSPSPSATLADTDGGALIGQSNVQTLTPSLAGVRPPENGCQTSIQLQGDARDCSTAHCPYACPRPPPAPPCCMSNSTCSICGRASSGRGGSPSTGDLPVITLGGDDGTMVTSQG